MGETPVPTDESRAEATAVQDERLREHEQHLAEINGSVRDAAIRLAAIETGLTTQGQMQEDILVRVIRLEKGQQFLIEEANVKPSTVRLWRIVRYLLWAVAAVVLVPGVPVSLESWPVALTSLWVMTMIGSAIACMVGALTDRWVVELFALPVLAGTVATLCLGLFASAASNTPRISIGIMLAIGAVDLGVRWREVVSHWRHEQRKNTEG